MTRPAKGFVMIQFPIRKALGGLLPSRRSRGEAKEAGTYWWLLPRSLLVMRYHFAFASAILNHIASTKSLLTPNMLRSKLSAEGHEFHGPEKPAILHRSFLSRFRPRPRRWSRGTRLAVAVPFFRVLLRAACVHLESSQREMIPSRWLREESGLGHDGCSAASVRSGRR